MARILRIAGWTAASIFGALILLVAIVFIGANTGGGQRMIERMAQKFSGGQMTMTGLSGRFPDRLRVAHIDLQDGKGIWGSIDALSLDWSPTKLLFGDLGIETLAAQELSLQRLPAQQTQSSSSKSGGLPLRVDIDALNIEKLALGADIAGQPAAVKLAGAAHLRSAQQGTIDLRADRLDGEGRYAVNATIDPNNLNAQIDAREPTQGLLAGLAGLSNIGPISLAAQIDGPRNAENLRLVLSAGPARAEATGTLDLVQQHLDLDLTANAPAMAPRPDLHWQAAKLDAHVHGGFTNPEANGQATIAALTSGDIALGELTAAFQGTAGQVGLTARLEGLHLAAPVGDLFASAPFELRADAMLSDPARPVSFTLAHPLLSVSGRAKTADGIAGTADITLADLTPLGALTGLDLKGQATIATEFAQQNDLTRLVLSATTKITGGEPVAALIGDNGHLALAVTQRGEDIALESASIDGKALRASAQGGLKSGTVAAQWSLTLSNLAPLSPTLTGSISAKGELRGALDHLGVTADADAEIGARNIRPTPVTLSLRLDDLPNAPNGQITAQGTLLGSALALSTALRRESDGTAHVTIERAQWKSAEAKGELTLPPGAMVPLGQMELRMARLDELEPLIGQSITGSLTASLTTAQSSDKPQLRLLVDGRRIGIAGNGAEQASIDARISDPLGKAVVTAAARLDGISANSASGKAQLDANGPLNALVLRLGADLQSRNGPARITASGKADVPQNVLQLSAMEASYANETARLLGPATIKAANGLAIQGLRLGVGQAVLTADGSIQPALNLTVALRNATPALAKPFMPALDADGSFTMNAKLGGSLAAPTGTIRVTGQGLRMRSGAARGLSAATLTANAELRGTNAALDTRVDAGNHARLRLNGTAPLQASGALDLHAAGTVDLVVLDPILTPNGRNARGQMTLDLGIAGALSAPRLSGTASLANGAVHDFAQGIHITELTGTINADGDTLRITKLTGRAGSGTLSVSGTLQPLEPDMPVDLTITAQNARLPASDLLTAEMSGALKIQGQATTRLDVVGQIKVARADINIPEKLPQSVAVLDVRRPGQKPPPPEQSSLVIGLGLGVDAPERVFVRGHGIDAEFGGSLQVSGTSDAPQISGGFNLRRGTYSLAGTTLNFTRGKISFDGTSPSGKLDPALDFASDTTANGVTATLAVTGYADAPKIQLSSSPELPQDEILAQLLFKQSVKQLTPLQIAQIAQALASLTGVGGSDPLAMVRKGLGLDRLSVGAASGNSSGATVEAGRYIANGVYVGAKQGTSGGTQGQVQIDLTKNLKLETTLGTGGSAPATGATPDNDPGSSVGLTYQLEY